MTTIDGILALDSAYRPFPTFSEWSSDRPIDFARWERYKTSYESHANLPKEILDRAREVAKRAAAVDTGAIEGLYEADRGFTFTVAFETSAWEVAMAEKGEQVRPLFEAQLHAYDYVLDLATKAEVITEASIRELHKVVCGPQETYRVVTQIGPQEQPLPKGQYKSLANHVRTRSGADHSYAPVDVTPAEMDRFIHEIRSEQFQAAHPVRQASYAHYAFVCVHPFADGNGRVARALASAFTYRAISMPIVILTEHKTNYLNALEAADAGNFAAFEAFMMARALDTIQLVDESIKAARAPQTADVAADIDKLYFTRGGYTLGDVDKFGTNLFDTLVKSLSEALVKYKGTKISTNVQPMPNVHQVIIPGQRVARVPSSLQVSLSTIDPVSVTVVRVFQLTVPKNAAGDDDMLVSTSPGGVEFSARIDEITPVISGVLQMRAKMFAERIASELANQLLGQATEKSRQIFGR
jgi:Fic family protein